VSGQRFLVLLGLALAIAVRPAAARQNPASPQPAGPAATQGKEHSHARDFLVKGTVFTNQSYAFPGAQVRLRRAGEKKYRWETYTNSRGEFAVRVPQGSSYELQVRSKGFLDQTRTIDAQAGNLEEGVTFRMQPAESKRKGGTT
jgi:hypothetical protein